MKRRVAVTGGSGQLGSHVLRRLCADRTVGEVRSIDVRPPVVVSSKLRAITADVRDSDFQRHLDGCDTVVHLAFIVAGLRPRAELDGINVEGSKNVFRAAAAAGATGLVYTSSVAAYGVVAGHPRPIIETTPRVHQPEFAYAAAKWEVERFLDDFEPAHPSLAVARIRPGILIGAAMDHVLGDLLRRRLVPDSGETPMPVVWDEDVADAVVLAALGGARGAFNAAADDPRSAADLARAGGMRLVRLPAPVRFGLAQLSRVLGRLHIGRAIDPSWLKALGPTMVMSSAKARAELGWKPRCPTASDVVRRYAETVPRQLDRRIAVFLRLVALAARSGQVPEEGRHISARIHLAFTGESGGDAALIFHEGRLTVERGVPRPPTAVITLKPRTFLDLLAGRADYATCGLTGKIRVEGEALAGLILQGLITTFRARRDFATRQLQRWFAKGATP